MSSVIPASMTTWRPPRSRTWRTRATSQPARATSARPGSIARRVGRRSAGTRVEQRRELAREPLRAGRRLVERQDREPAADVERVERRRARRASRPTTASPRRTASRHASTAPSCEPTWRWTPRGRSGPAACALSHSTSAGRLGLGHPELGRARRRRPGPAMRLGRDVRVEPDEDVERRPAAASEPGAPRHPGEDLRLVGRFERDPAERRAGRRGPDGRAQVGVGLADALERDPVVRRRRRAVRSPTRRARRRWPRTRARRPRRRSPGRRWP